MRDNFSDLTARVRRFSDLTARVRRRYSLAWFGSIGLAQIQSEFDSSDRLELSLEQQRQVDGRWSRLEGSGVRLHDAPLYRLRSVTVSGRALTLALGQTSYREYQGTNIAGAGLATTDPKSLANPVAVSCVTVTSDGLCLVHRRSRQTAEYQGYWHVTPSGHLHPPEDLRSAIGHELEEELGIGDHDLASEPQASGIVVNAEFHKPDVLAFAHVEATHADVLGRRRVDSWEYERLEPLAWEPEPVKRWLTEHVDDSVPQGHAAILAAAAAEFDDPWLDRLATSLIQPWHSL